MRWALLSLVFGITVGPFQPARLATQASAQETATLTDAVEVQLDATEVPELEPWGQEARELLLRWYPRVNNLLPSKDREPAKRISIKLRKTDKGVAATTRARITVSSHWIEKHPEDMGLVVHELVHVIQAYPSADPWWLTEGIADYLRWGIYEGKPQEWFQRPQIREGYKKGYQIMGGFLLWLETEKAPGIVSQLHTAMQQQKYSESMFEEIAGKPLDELWNDYVTEGK